MVHSLLMTGKFSRLGVVKGDGQRLLERRHGRLSELQGMLGFIDYIDEKDKQSRQARAACSVQRSASEKMYRAFLLYSMFYSAEMPILVCEGPTDNVYLTHAIRALAADFPQLAEVQEGRKIRLRVRFYKYPQSRTSVLLGLTGGTGQLKSFIAAYKKDTDRFKGLGLVNPVIVVYDSDDGAPTIRNVIKNCAHVQVKGSEPFVHVTRNLYAVSTPLKDGEATSKIEDFFDEHLLATKIGVKTFNPSNNYDSKDHYGKIVFAHKIVRRKADAIDFAGFRPLLRNLTAAIERHKELIDTDKTS